MAYNESQKKATAKYKTANYKRIPLDVQKSQYDEIKAHAEVMGESVNGFIKRAISETMERDAASTGAQSAQEAEPPHSSL